MAISDIIVIALLALFGVIGVLIAVKKSLLSLAAFLVAFVIAFFLSTVVAEALMGIEGIRTFVIGGDGWSLYTWIHGGIGESVSAHYPIDWTTLELLPDQTPTALGTNFYAPILEIVKGFGYTAQFTADQGVSLYLAFIMFSAIVGVALFIVIRLLLIIVTAIIKSFIEKRKSGVARFFGLLVGMVEGFCVSLALMIILSTMGGLTFVEAFNNISGDMETSVIAKHVNGWAYGIRNGVFLPNADMYGRIVELSGFTVKEEDKEDDRGSRLIGKDIEMYNDLYNLNYLNGNPYYTDLEGYGVEPDDKTRDMFDYTLYSDSGFGAAVKAITEFNAASAEKIKEAGSLLNLGMTNTEITLYIEYIHDAKNSIHNIWRGNNGDQQPIFVLLSNYETYIDQNKNLATESAITAANAELTKQYNDLVSEFGRLKDQYNNISEHFGTIDWDEIIPTRAYQIVPEVVEE